MWIPTSIQIFQITSGFLTILFLHYGMDLRRKPGSRNFVGPVYQLLMRLSSLALIGGFLALVFSSHRVSGIDVLSLAVMASRTCFVVAAKRALGKAHTFTGQYLDKPALVTRGVYSTTRNPLYLGVFQCELGAALFALHQLPLIFPQRYAVLMVVSTVALINAVLFNWTMALRESRYLEQTFGDDYRRYSARVPFLFPSI